MFNGIEANGGWRGWCSVMGTAAQLHSLLSLSKNKRIIIIIHIYLAPFISWRKISRCFVWILPERMPDDGVMSPYPMRASGQDRSATLRFCALASLQEAFKKKKKTLQEERQGKIWLVYLLIQRLTTNKAAQDNSHRRSVHWPLFIVIRYGYIVSPCFILSQDCHFQEWWYALLLFFFSFSKPSCHVVVKLCYCAVLFF